MTTPSSPLPPSGSVTGHVLDYAALHDIVHTGSPYGREVVRQSSVYGVTLLVSALDVELLWLTSEPKTVDLFCSLSIVLVATPAAADLAKARHYSPQLVDNYNDVHSGADFTTYAAVNTALPVAFAIDRGWHLITAAPAYYRRIDGLRLEILP